MENLKQRLLNSIIIDNNTDCWNWSEGKDKDGYGKICVNRKHLRAHRLSYEVFISKFDSKNIICHKCDNPSCINPDHLFLGTWLTNMQDKVNKGRLRNQNMDKTHCKNGHEFSSDNTILNDNRRTCVICYKERYKIRNSRILTDEQIQLIKFSGFGKFCKRGHEFTPDNTWVGRNGIRTCKHCNTKVTKSVNCTGTGSTNESTR